MTNPRSRARWTPPRALVGLLVLAACAAPLRTPEATMQTRPLPVPAEDPSSSLWGFRDAEGAWELSPRWDLVQPFTAGGIAAVVDRDGWRYVDRAGHTAIARPWIVDNAPDAFQEGLARAVEGDRFVFFDEAGRVVLQTPFAYAEPFAEGLAPVCDGCTPERVGEHLRFVGGRWGYLDHAGQVVIPCRYDEATGFDGGTARVRLDGRWFSIDPAGRPVVE